MSLLGFQTCCLHWPLILPHQPPSLVCASLIGGSFLFYHVDPWSSASYSEFSLLKTRAIGGHLCVCVCVCVCVCILSSEYPMFVVLVTASWLPLEESLLPYVCVVWIGWRKPAVHLVVLTTPRSKNGRVKNLRTTEECKLLAKVPCSEMSICPNFYSVTSDLGLLWNRGQKRSSLSTGLWDGQM